MKLNHVLLQILAMAAAGNTVSLPKGILILSHGSRGGGLLIMNLANSQTGQMQINRQLSADTTVAKEAAFYPRETDGNDVWQKSAADAEMDADDAVAYSDGIVDVQEWGAPSEKV